MADLFKDNVETYKESITYVDKSIYDGIIYDSKIESTFAARLNEMKSVKLFLKMPDWFVVETPVGEYNPDWAIVTEPSNQFGEIKSRLYLVTETKGMSLDLQNRERYCVLKNTSAPLTWIIRWFLTQKKYKDFRFGRKESD